MSLRIGSVLLEDPLIQAPMAGVSDLPFRLLCREQGAALVCSEMISAKALYYHNKNSESLLLTTSAERPLSLQLFGSDPDLIAEMAAQIEEHPFDILDLNMGCPMQKVVKNGEGAALMRNPKLVEAIVSKTVRAIRKPVTVKIRKGFNENEVNAVEIAKIAQDAGAAAVIVHGRTREEYFSGKADWGIIRQVKEALEIPVIGNGDVDSPRAAKRMMSETGCDGVAVAGAARGNPWLFHEIKTYLRTDQIPPRPTKDEVREMMLRHARMEVACKGETIGIRQMRGHCCRYTAGYPNSAKLRGRINQVETYAELEELLNEQFV